MFVSFRSARTTGVLALLVSLWSVAAHGQEEKGWFAFNPADSRGNSPIDLRSLNEKTAGDNGFIGVRGSAFIHSKTGQPVVFWAVNGPASKDRASLPAE